MLIGFLVGKAGHVIALAVMVWILLLVAKNAPVLKIIGGPLHDAYVAAIKHAATIGGKGIGAIIAATAKFACNLLATIAAYVVWVIVCLAVYAWHGIRQWRASKTGRRIPPVRYPTPPGWVNLFPAPAKKKKGGGGSSGVGGH